MASKAEAKISTDHQEIQAWAEARGGKPACVKGTGDPGDIGMIRIDFPGYSGEDSLQPITWEEWFDKFDEQGLALLHQETTAAGEQSNFNKLVSRKTAAKVPAKKVPAKKVPAKKAPVKKKAVAKKQAPAKKAVAKKAPAKKAVAKKPVAKKAVVKKAVKKTAARGRGR